MFPERWYAVVTTGFVHVELNHIIVNMLLLLWGGTRVERLIGSRRFAVLVFVSILAGSLSILVRDTAGIGFGAAAAAIVFYYHVVFPFERELPLRVPNIVLPVVLFVGSLEAAVFGWFPEVGHRPHLAGAVVGLLFLVVFRRHHRPLEDHEPQPAAGRDLVPQGRKHKSRPGLSMAIMGAPRRSTARRQRRQPSCPRVAGAGPCGCHDANTPHLPSAAPPAFSV